MSPLQRGFREKFYICGKNSFTFPKKFPRFILDHGNKREREKEREKEGE